ncbi:hypothetical protein KIW84_056508 [Lathyrus oleraceus]|uniref:Uncharacterized protein n=1 Tax=Pisum sativum TaxID=3888 RepID=A0A9D4X0R5_PEA|nr:hypothetical protein KIW84_056508 [Pisum sativum]
MSCSMWRKPTWLCCMNHDHTKPAVPAKDHNYMLQKTIRKWTLNMLQNHKRLANYHVLIDKTILQALNMEPIHQVAAAACKKKKPVMHVMEEQTLRTLNLGLEGRKRSKQNYTMMVLLHFKKLVQESLRIKNSSTRKSPVGKSPSTPNTGEWRRMSLPTMLVGETIGEILHARQFAKELVSAINCQTPSKEDPKTPIPQRPSKKTAQKSDGIR